MIKHVERKFRRICAVIALLLVGVFSPFIEAAAHRLHHGGSSEMYGYYVESVSAPWYYRCASADNFIDHSGGNYYGRGRSESKYGPFCAGDYGQAVGIIKAGAVVMQRYSSTEWRACLEPVYADNPQGSHVAEAQAYDANACDSGLCYYGISSHNVWILTSWHGAFFESPKRTGSGACP